MTLTAFAVIGSLFIWRLAYMYMAMQPDKYRTPFASSTCLIPCMWATSYVAGKLAAWIF